jgi:hypothetical protein
MTAKTLTPPQLREMKERRKANARKMVGQALTCQLCPQVNEDVARLVLSMPVKQSRRKVTATSIRVAEELLASPQWQTRLLTWLDAFWAEHSHGPTWRTVKDTAELWPKDCSLSVKAAVMERLSKTGLVDGTRTPYGLKVRTQEAASA